MSIGLYLSQQQIWVQFMSPRRVAAQNVAQNVFRETYHVL